MKKSLLMILSAVLSVFLLTGTAYLCGYSISFRAYLNKSFWQPFAMYEDSIAKARVNVKKKTEGMQPVERRDRAFAGYSSAPASEALLKVRRAYIARSYDKARAELAAAQRSGLVEREMDELRLIDAKLDMRIAEQENPVKKELLLKSQQKLEGFLSSSIDPLWRSEARGWLARVHYLLGRYSTAVKIYLDELNRQDTILDRGVLITSLHMIFPYNGSTAGLADHLEEYFDTPEHALFVVNIVTNPIGAHSEERASMAKVARRVIDGLKKHKELFNGSELSAQLTLALMRASIYMGDTRSALEYSMTVKPTSKAARTVDYNWMKAICYFLQKDYEKAEGPLLKVIRSKEARKRELCAAALGLAGVYERLGRRTDQLHATFLYEKYRNTSTDADEPLDLDQFTVILGEDGYLLDVPYLLDIQLADEELKEYLIRYGKESQMIQFQANSRRSRTAYEGVEYAIAVRFARQEKYNDAAVIYERLNASPRASRMRVLASLYETAADKSLQADKRLEAQYRYASFLEEHSTQIFFNDMIWGGLQTETFMDNKNVDMKGLTGEERNELLKKERKVRDEQEERWRAYHLMAAITEQAGYTELGKKAAVKAIRCLDLINTNRFGRAEEIDLARRKLLKWLRDFRNHANGSKT